jgi:IS5 family transposase
VIATRRRQRSFADGFICDEVEDLWESWMRHADKALEDEALLLLIQQELMKRCKNSKTRGRPGKPAEVVLRMMLLKHVCDWSYQVLTREVRANLVYRQFTRIGGGRVPDDKTMGRLGRQLGPESVKALHDRVAQIARENKATAGKKLRVDTTVDVATLCYTSLSL